MVLQCRREKCEDFLLDAVDNSRALRGIRGQGNIFYLQVITVIHTGVRICTPMRRAVFRHQGCTSVLCWSIQAPCWNQWQAASCTDLHKPKCASQSAHPCGSNALIRTHTDFNKLLSQNTCPSQASEDGPSHACKVGTSVWTRLYFIKPNTSEQ